MDPCAIASPVSGWERLATLDGWSALGQAVGGFATAAAVGVAVFTLRRWKNERRAERRGDAAARAITALIAARGSVLDWTLKTVLPVLAHRGQPAEQLFRMAMETFKSTRAERSGSLRELRSVQSSVAPHLLSDEMAILGDMASLLSTGAVQMGAAASFLAANADPDAALKYVQEKADELKDKAFDIERRGKVLLGPVARFEAAVPSSSDRNDPEPAESAGR